jgi:hypothetical protein
LYSIISTASETAIHGYPDHEYSETAASLCTARTEKQCMQTSTAPVNLDDAEYVKEEFCENGCCPQTPKVYPLWRYPMEQ